MRNSSPLCTVIIPVFFIGQFQGDDSTGSSGPQLTTAGKGREGLPIKCKCSRSSYKLRFWEELGEVICAIESERDFAHESSLSKRLQK